MQYIWGGQLDVHSILIHQDKPAIGMYAMHYLLITKRQNTIGMAIHNNVFPVDEGISTVTTPFTPPLLFHSQLDGPQSHCALDSQLSFPYANQMEHLSLVKRYNRVCFVALL
eukprot:459219_1